MRPLVPPELTLDLYDGAAWVGLIPFVIDGFTLPHAPSIPWLSKFAETNVRTYVIDRQGRRGVWFFSLDAARLAAVVGARLGYALPYFWDEMSVVRLGDTMRYRSRRRFGPPAETNIVVQIKQRIASPTERDHFLTARFRLYARRGGRIVRANVEHQPWPLQAAVVTRLQQNLIEAAGLPLPEGEPLVHFSERVDVLTGAPHW